MSNRPWRETIRRISTSINCDWTSVIPAVSSLLEMDTSTPTRYCLYARKSSESDERQAMSIDSQIKEMSDLAQKENLFIKNIYKESHSAKESGQRPVFVQLLNDVRNGQFNGILTWAPDRLSRNAGDLGMLVDLMDQEKLHQIRTYSQVFSNNPNEKFLLMILCSQAKLENDQKGLNVKRGIRAKCEMGWRPGPTPIGYMNRSFAGKKDIITDPDRGKFVTGMFEMALTGKSGRQIEKWTSKAGFTNKSGKPILLSQIYRMLADPFYYGEFEYPVGSGTWYKGSHKPLITKSQFTQVRKKLAVAKKSKWGSRRVLFRATFRCGSCGASVTGEEKFRERQGREPKRHVYYQCAQARNKKCQEAMVSEEELIIALAKYVNFMGINHPQKIMLTPKIRIGMETFRKIREQVLLTQDIDPDEKSISFVDYAKYILKEGADEDKKEIVKVFKDYLYLHHKQICSSPIL